MRAVQERLAEIAELRREEVGEVVAGAGTLAEVLLADWSQYPEVYRVEEARLREVMEVFPQGVTVYRGRWRGGWWPVGYACWHPFVWREGEGDEGVRVVSAGEDGGRLPVYLFNYSVHPAFYRSGVSRRLLQGLAAEVAGRRLCAATVSEDGARVAARFGMRAIRVYLKRGAPWTWWESG